MQQDRRCTGPTSQNTLPFYVSLLTRLQRLAREPKPPHKNQRRMQTTVTAQTTSLPLNAVGTFDVCAEKTGRFLGSWNI